MVKSVESDFRKGYGLWCLCGEGVFYRYLLAPFLSKKQKLLEINFCQAGTVHWEPEWQQSKKKMNPLISISNSNDTWVHTRAPGLSCSSMLIEWVALMHNELKPLWLDPVMLFDKSQVVNTYKMQNVLFL